MTEPKKLDVQEPETLPEAVFDCPMHGAYSGRSFKMSLFGRTKVYDPPCPKCEAEEEGEKERHARDRLKAVREERLAAMNIDRMYWGKGFDDFIASTPELKRHLETAMNFAANPRGKLVMLGNNGTGKTHLAASILQKTGGVFYTAYEIGVNLRHSYNGNTREKDVLDELCSVNVLVIDEIGRTKEDSDADIRWMSHVINKRHANFMPLVLISNRHLRRDCPENADKGCKKCLENFFDDDVTSRVVEDGIRMNFTGGDYRRKIREARGGKAA